MSFRRCCTIAILIIVASCLSACKQRMQNAQLGNEVEELLKREKKCNLIGATKYDTAKYEGVWNAAYAYEYIAPKVFKDSTIDVIDKNNFLISDTSYIFSPDKKAAIKIWIGDTVPFPLGMINGRLTVNDFLRVDSAAANIIRRIKQERYPYFGKAKIDYICCGYEGYSQRIILLGHNSAKNFICKIDIGELPVSGDLIEKNIVFYYDSQFSKYQKVGNTVVGNFTGFH